MYDEVGEPLRFWFAVCFGFAAAASAIAISLKLHLLVCTIRARHNEFVASSENRSMQQESNDVGFQRVASSKTNPMEKRLDTVRLELRAVYCFILVTLFDDIPLGSLNLAYVRLMLLNPTNVKAQSTTGAILTLATFGSTFCIIGYNCRKILGLPDIWHREHALVNASVILERARLALQRHSLARAVRRWWAASIFEDFPPVRHPPAAINVATIDVVQTFGIADDGLQNEEETSAMTLMRAPTELTADTNSAVLERARIVLQRHSMACSVRRWRAGSPPTIDVAQTSEIADVRIRNEGEASAAMNLIRVPREATAMKRNALSVGCHSAVSGAIVTIERSTDVVAMNLSHQGPDQPQEISSCDRTLALRWDEMKSEAVVSISRVSNAEVDYQAMKHPLRRRRDATAGRIRRVLDDEASVNPKGESAKPSPKAFIGDEPPEITSQEDSAFSPKSLSRIWFERHGHGNSLAARRAAHLNGAAADARLCAPHQLRLHGAALLYSNSSNGTGRHTACWRHHSPKQRHRLLAHNAETTSQSALERMEALVQAAEQKAETAALRFASLHAAASDESCSDLESGKQSTLLRPTSMRDAIPQQHATANPLHAGSIDATRSAGDSELAWV
jgi:hypothetical protein